MKNLRTLLILSTLALSAGLCDTASAQAHRTKAKKATPTAQETAQKRIADKLQYTEKILVFDSTVVKRTSLTKALRLPKHLGRIDTYAHMFGKQAPDTWMAYSNEFGDRRLFSMADSAGHMKIYTTDKVGQTWTKPRRITDFDTMFSDMTCPYLSDDGNTLYFAAKGEESIGGYDIYRTYYDSEAQHYVTPENMGLPYNSQSDDYYCIVSDIDSLGWLVTNRRQPSGDACIYSFVSAQPRLNYTDDDLDDSQLFSLAEIKHIRDTWKLWKDKRGVEKAKKRLASISNTSTENQSQTGEFIVNDDTVYSSIEQFPTSETKQGYVRLIQLRKAVQTLSTKLDAMREQYSTLSAGNRAGLSAQILRMENQLMQMQTETARLGKALRNMLNK